MRAWRLEAVLYGAPFAAVLVVVADVTAARVAFVASMVVAGITAAIHGEATRRHRLGLPVRSSIHHLIATLPFVTGSVLLAIDAADVSVGRGLRVAGWACLVGALAVWLTPVTPARTRPARRSLAEVVVSVPVVGPDDPVTDVLRRRVAATGRAVVRRGDRWRLIDADDPAWRLLQARSDVTAWQAARPVPAIDGT